MKKYILIAGVNGAGKSTLYQTLHSLHEMIRVNTDEIVRRIGDWRSIERQIEAGKIAVSQLKECFEKGVTFNQETNTESFRRFAIYRRGTAARVSHIVPLWYVKLIEEEKKIRVTEL